MAESEDKQAKRTPAIREGRSVSILENRALITQAFRDGWVKSVELAEDLLDDAIEDVSAAREAGEIDAIEMAKVSMALANIAQGAANMRTKAVQASESQPPKTDGATHNTQINIFNASQTDESLAKLSDDELAKRIRDARIDRDGAGTGAAEAPESPHNPS